MGCFHSVPKSTKQEAPRENQNISPVGVALDVDASHEPQLVVPGFTQAGPEICDELILLDREDFEDAREVDIPSGSLSLSQSPESDRNMSSGAAVNASSHIEHSDEDLGNPSTPGLTVSPNPGSPTGATSNVLVSAILADMQPATALATLPESNVVRFQSRLQQVAQLANAILCLQVFSVWRCEVLKARISEANAKISSVGEASRLILEENESLRHELEELRKQLPSKPTQSDASIQIDPIQGAIARGYLSPPGNAESIGFLTPLSSRGSPLPAPISIATPPKKSWDDYAKEGSAKPESSPALKLANLAELIKPFELSNKRN